ncbi:MAG: DNRLRE domain-containing protein [Polyangiaceae bacterium]|nr:DNRLRE domain-containing protein [Polyangiaceae bacterium]
MKHCIGYGFGILVALTACDPALVLGQGDGQRLTGKADGAGEAEGAAGATAAQQEASSNAEDSTGEAEAVHATKGGSIPVATGEASSSHQTPSTPVTSDPEPDDAVVDPNEGTTSDPPPKDPVAGPDPEPDPDQQSAAAAGGAGSTDDPIPVSSAGSGEDPDLETVRLEAVADTLIRTDLDARGNDNYGCQQILVVGTGRGGGGIAWGAADAMRSLVQFDLSNLPADAAIQSATLEMTVTEYDNGQPSSVYRVDAHRIIDPWREGNGLEYMAYGEQVFDVPQGCTNVDEADGVAWAGADAGGDANNETQPSFDEEVAGRALVDQSVHVAGDVIRWDITALVRAWHQGSVNNYGIMLRDSTTDESFRGVRFGARDARLRCFPDRYAEDGPALVVELMR